MKKHLNTAMKSKFKVEAKRKNTFQILMKGVAMAKVNAIDQK